MFQATTVDKLTPTGWTLLPSDSKEPSNATQLPRNRLGDGLSIARPPHAGGGQEGQGRRPQGQGGGEAHYGRPSQWRAEVRRRLTEVHHDHGAAANRSAQRSSAGAAATTTPAIPATDYAGTALAAPATCRAVHGPDARRQPLHRATDQPRSRLPGCR